MSPAVMGRLFCYPGLCNTNSPREYRGLVLEHGECATVKVDDCLKWPKDCFTILAYSYKE